MTRRTLVDCKKLAEKLGLGHYSHGNHIEDYLNSGQKRWNIAMPNLRKRNNSHSQRPIYVEQGVELSFPTPSGKNRILFYSAC